MNLLKVKHKGLVLGICFALNIFILAVSGMMMARFAENLVKVGNTAFSVSSLNGSLQSVTFVMCIIMVCVDTKYGLLLSYISLVSSILGALRATFQMSGHSALPGVMNSIVLIISITIISEQIRTTILDSQTDVITGVYNRRGFLRQLSDAARQKKGFKLISLRLINLRMLCDDLGLEHGDEILKIVAERMKKVVDPEYPIGCIDASSFMIILPESEDAKALSEKLIDEIQGKLVIHKESGPINCDVKACVGIASYPADGKNAEKLMKTADLALRHCILESDKDIVVYDNELKECYERRSLIEKSLREAVSNNNFYIVYQPQFLAEGKKLRGFEALLRLKLPDGTVYEPTEFIKIAERSDLIISVDEYVLNRAMNEFSDVVRQGDNMLTLSINISGRTISDQNFIKILNKAVRSNEFPPECLEIEVEEKMFANENDQLEANVRALKRMGVKIALDDFGAGYSSLSQLMHLRISLLKIDKSLVDDFTVGKHNKEFMDSVISLGHIMGSSVITQGVETEEQLEELKKHEVDMIQGFVWGHPMEYKEALSLIRK